MNTKRVTTIIVAVTLATLLASGNPALANNVEVPFSGSVKNSSGTTKTDYHVRVTSDINMKFKQGTLNVYGPLGGWKESGGTPTVTGDNTHELTFDWTNLTIEDGDSVAWGVIVTEWIYNKVNIEEEYFTQINATDPPIPGLGFGVEENGEFYLTNSTDLSISFDNLSVSIGDERLTLDAMIDAVRADPVPGISGTVDSQSRLVIETYDELLPGMFLQASMVTSVTTVDGVTNTSQRVIGHEHPVEIPTVSQWGLILMAFLLLTAGAIVIVRRRRQVTV